MNKLLHVPQHRLPTDTTSGCFTDLLHCLLCGGTVSTRSLIGSPAPHSTSVSRKFSDLLQNGDDQVQVGRLPDQQVKAELPIVARLMGLDTPVDMSWKPRVSDDMFNRSKSVNYVDYLFHSRPEPEPSLFHRRVKTCLSFRDGEFLVVCLEKSSKKSVTKCDQKRVKYAQADRSGAKTERRKKDKAEVLREEGSNSGSLRHLSGGIKLAQGITTDVEQTDRMKAGTTCQRNANRRTARSGWQQKNDYYKKPQALKSQCRGKATQKDVIIPSKTKLKKEQMDVNHSSSELDSKECSVSNRLRPSATQRRRVKTCSGNLRPRAEERRSSRRSKVPDHGSGTLGELMMMKKIKYMIEQDLEMGRWNCGNEAGFLLREYVSTFIELGILDELVNQIVHDLASKCHV